jgi:hypothetical protein
MLDPAALSALTALTDGVLTLSVPGTQEEAAHLQQLIPTLLADALLEFRRARESNPDAFTTMRYPQPSAYVALKYPQLSGDERAEKIRQVTERLEAARLLHNVVLRVEVNLL